jgi:hypothetical protein
LTICLELAALVFLSKVFWCTFNLNIGRWDEICCFQGITVLADSARRDHWNFVAGYLCSLDEELGICMSPGEMAVVQGFSWFDGVSLKDVETRHTPFIYVVFICTEKYSCSFSYSVYTFI